MMRGLGFDIVPESPGPGMSDKLGISQRGLWVANLFKFQCQFVDLSFLNNKTMVLDYRSLCV